MKSETKSELHLSIPGFNIAFNTNTKLTMKLIWLLLFLICSVICLVFLTGRIVHYYNYPVVVTYEINGNGSVVFPKISFCYSHVSEETGIQLRNRWNTTYNSLISNCFSWKATMSCQKKTFWKTQLTATGMAYTLDTVNFSNSTNLWIMRFKLDENAIDDNWKILLHDDDDDVIYGCRFSSHPIEREYVNNFVFTRTQFIYENVPGRPCIDANAYKECLMSCWNHKILNGASYRLPDTNSDGLLPDFADKVNTDAFESGIAHSFSVCNCHRPCIDSHIEVDVDTISTEDDETKLSVYNSREEVAILKEKRSFVFYALLCDIGGIIGFYLGACLLTFTEITHIIIRRWQWHRRRKFGKPFIKQNNTNNLKKRTKQ